MSDDDLDPWEGLRSDVPPAAPAQRTLSPRRPTRPARPPAAAPRRQRTGRGRDWRRLVRPGLLGLAGIVAIGVLAAVSASSPRGSSPPVAAGTVADATLPPEEPATTSTTIPPCPVSAAPLAADVDGDGCPEDLSIENGVLITPLGRFAVGAAGDLALVGDWDCDGTATPAAFRPATGAVFLFPTWATEGDVQVTPTATVTGAVSAEAIDLDGDGCTEVIVRRPDGEPEIVRAP
jgi:hypothetical protein